MRNSILVMVIPYNELSVTGLHGALDYRHHHSRIIDIHTGKCIYCEIKLSKRNGGDNEKKLK